MQDRYAGDIGDFVKLGLLRAISPGYLLGLAWYHFPDEAHNNDGRHIDYIGQRELFGALDPDLFEHLASVVVGERSIASLLPILPDAVTSKELIDLTKVPSRQKREWRSTWFTKLLKDLERCDLVFADPDNGVVDDNDARKGRPVFGKQIPLNEVQRLAKGRCAVIYHHNTRRKGGHDAEVDHWLDQFGMHALAVRATAFSPRTFFVINPTQEIEGRVKAFCDQWERARVRLHRPGNN